MTDSNSKYKVFVYSLCGSGGFLASMVLWWAVSQVLMDPFATFANIGQYSGALILIILGLLGALSAFILTAVLVPENKARVGFYTLFSTGGLVIAVSDLPAAIVVSLSSVLVFVVIDSLTQRDLKNHLTLQLAHIFMRRVTVLITVFAILFSVLLFRAGARTVSSVDLQISPGLIDQGIDLIMPFIENNLDDQTQDILMNEAIHQLDQRLPALAELPTEDKRSLLEGHVTPNLRNHLNSLNMPDDQIDQLAINLQELLRQDLLTSGADVTTQIIDRIHTETLNLLNKFLQDNKDYAPGIISSLSFLILLSIGFLFKFFAIGITSIILNIMQRLGWIRLHEYEVTATQYRINTNDAVKSN